MVCWAAATIGASSEPPPTVPVTAPSAPTSMAVPGLRGVEPWQVMTTASASGSATAYSTSDSQPL